MKLQYLPLLGIILLMNACMWGVPKSQSPGVAQDTLAYTYKTILQKAADCGKLGSGCTIAKIVYPVFTNSTALNDTIKHKLTSLFIVEDKPDTGLNQLSKHFLQAYAEDTAPANKSGVKYRFDIDTKIVRQDSSIVTLQIDGSVFNGGAHGSSRTYFINWDTKTNKPVYLENILANGYQTKLTPIADSIFRKNEKLSDTASLKTNYFFKNGVFSLNDNYLITPLGIRFLYNEYEIKPYAAGQTNLLIPYAKIKSLLLPHTVVSQYLK